jgi:hypothetical protein
MQIGESDGGPTCILVLPTTHHTLAAEETLRSANIHNLPVPKPSKAASDCGMAIRIKHCDLARAAKALERMDVNFFLEKPGAEIEPVGLEEIQSGDRK